MIKRALLIIIFIATGLSGYTETLTQSLNSLYYQQNYCSKTTPQNSITFLKQNADYAADICDNIPVNKNDDISRQYSDLLKSAESNPKKYGYLIALANMYGIGTNLDNKLAETWLLKSINKGSSKSKVVYASFLMQHTSTEECDTAEKSIKCDEKARKILSNVNFNDADTMLTGFYPGSENEACKIVTKAVNNGMLNSYPVYLSCITNGFKKPFTTDMKEKLNQVITNKKTSIAAKKQAANLLGNNYEFDLLNAIK